MTARCPLLVAATILLAGGLASAQPAPSPPPDKVDAQSLMQSGVRLLEIKDYLGALAIFKDAYARFPSAKILLNIGTTYNLLGRKDEAANAYQRYLDAADSDPARKGDVTAALADLDHSVGTLEISISPPDAEIQVNDGDWMPAAAGRLHRVPSGLFTVRARKPKHQPAAKSASIDLGQKTAIALALTPIDDGFGDVGKATDELAPGRTTRQPRSRIGGIAMAHLDLPRQGGAARVGLTFDVTPLLQAQGAALLGPAYGAYAGASFALSPGALKPFVAGGFPIFFSDGARFGLRGGGGVELQLTRHVSLLAELGVEVMLNPEDDILKAAFIPALGATGRL